MKSQKKFFILVSLLLLSIISCSQNKKISSNSEDWFKAGSKPGSYETGKDENVKYMDEPSIYIKSAADVKEGFGTLMKYMKPDEYKNKRLKLTGYIKSENVDNWAGMWMRVDGPERNKSLQFDNMFNRPIKGTNDWTKCEVVLDVPENSTGIAYGFLLNGNGEIWFSNLSFETVSKDVPVTNMVEELKTIDGWIKAGSTPYLYEIGKDDSLKFNGETTYYLKSTGKNENGFGTIMKEVPPEEYLGKRIKMTGMIKSEKIENWAGMWMRVDGPVMNKSLQFDNMKDRPIKGTNDWTKYEIVLDVPKNSTEVAYGVLISGEGKIWFADMKFEEVSKDISTTNILSAAPKDTGNNYIILPDKLKNIPDGIEVKNEPVIVKAEKTKNDSNFYYWSYKTSVKALNENLEITEFGSYTWSVDHWEFNTVTGNPFTKKDFEDWYNCKDGKLVKGKTFADNNNWSRGTELQSMRVLWYFLGKNEKGEIFKGTATAACLPELKK